MSKDKDWPKTCYVEFFREKTQSVCHWGFQADNAKGLYFKLQKMNFKADDIFFFYQNGISLSKDEIKKVVEWVEKKRKEQEGAKGKLQKS